MYESFYGLSEKPFSILPDPSFIYWAKSHRFAFSMLEYGVMNGAGFTVITGEIGSGKTTLVRELLRNIDDEGITVGLLSQTGFTDGELLPWLMMTLGQRFDQQSNIALYAAFQEYLTNEFEKGKRTVIIIDEAQNLPTKLLEELRMLSNINADKDHILQVILLGQPQLKERLRQPELAQFAQRVSSDFHVHSLDQDEVEKYIAHRLRVAGGSRALFTSAACRRIHNVSGGVPRVVNILCDTALVYGFASEADKITERIVNSVIKSKSEYGLFPFDSDRNAPLHLKRVNNY